MWQGHGRGYRTILASLSLHVKIAGEICIFNVKIADQKFGKGEGMKRDRMGRTREDTGEDTGTLSGWRGIAGRVSRFWGGKRIKYAVFLFCLLVFREHLPSPDISQRKALVLACISPRVKLRTSGRPRIPVFLERFYFLFLSFFPPVLIHKKNATFFFKIPTEKSIDFLPLIV